MKSKAAFLAVLYFLCSVVAFGQQATQGGGQGQRGPVADAVASA